MIGQYNDDRTIRIAQSHKICREPLGYIISTHYHTPTHINKTIIFICSTRSFSSIDMAATSEISFDSSRYSANNDNSNIMISNALDYTTDYLLPNDVPSIIFCPTATPDSNVSLHPSVMSPNKYCFGADRYTMLQDCGTPSSRRCARADAIEGATVRKQSSGTPPVDFMCNTTAKGSAYNQDGRKESNMTTRRGGRHHRRTNNGDFFCYRHPITSTSQRNNCVR